MCMCMHSQRFTTLDLTLSVHFRYRVTRQMLRKENKKKTVLTLILSLLVNLKSRRKGLTTAGSRRDSCLGNTLFGGIIIR